MIYLDKCLEAFIIPTIYQYELTSSGLNSRQGSRLAALGTPPSWMHNLMNVVLLYGFKERDVIFFSPAGPQSPDTASKSFPRSYLLFCSRESGLPAHSLKTAETKAKASIIKITSGLTRAAKALTKHTFKEEGLLLCKGLFGYLGTRTKCDSLQTPDQSRRRVK